MVAASGSSTLVDQPLELLVDRLGRHVGPQHAAAGQPGTLVAQVPPGDRPHRRVGEADAIELHRVVGLGRLVPHAFAVRAGDLLPARGRRELGDVQLLAQRGVMVEDLLHPVEREPHGPRLVGLDADAVEGHAVLLGRGQQRKKPGRRRPARGSR